jgi:hypothetical protein
VSRHEHALPDAIRSVHVGGRAVVTGGGWIDV